MALTRATANTVVDAVGADAECLHRIKSAFFLVPWGQAGATRNFGMAFLNSTSMLADDGWHWILQRDPDFARSWLGQYLLKKDLTVFDPSDASTEQYVCTGIATATADAICRARTASPAAFARVASVDTVSRSKSLRTHRDPRADSRRGLRLRLVEDAAPVVPDALPP